MQEEQWMEVDYCCESDRVSVGDLPPCLTLPLRQLTNVRIWIFWPPKIECQYLWWEILSYLPPCLTVHLQHLTIEMIFIFWSTTLKFWFSFCLALHIHILIWGGINEFGKWYKYECSALLQPCISGRPPFGELPPIQRASPAAFPRPRSDTERHNINMLTSEGHFRCIMHYRIAAEKYFLPTIRKCKEECALLFHCQYRYN